MHISIDTILVALSLLLLASIAASKVSVRLGIPALLLFLGIGMLAGSEGPGGIYFDDAWLAQLLGVVALTLILFSGGLDTQIADIRPVLGQGLVLSTAGVLITALAVGWFATLVLDFSFKEGVLLGAIIASTDAAAVFSVLRGRSLDLKHGLKPLLELESGSNDPMAVFLTLGLIRLVEHPDASVLGLIPFFLRQMVLGVLLGYGAGWLIRLGINRLRLEYDGLYPVLTVALALLAYSATSALGGNGFLAVYLAGVMTGNDNLIHKSSLKRFHEALAWLMQILMFLALGLLVFPSRLLPLAGSALLIATFLILVARPLSVLITLAWTRRGWSEKVFLSWVGLRGAAPIILATFPMLADLPRSETLFNLVFFIVLTSILVQGTSLAFVARWLKVGAPAQARTAYPLEFVPAASLKSELIELTLAPGSPVIGRRVVELGFPEAALIVLLNRGGEFIIPAGSTTLEAGDTILVFSEREYLDDVRSIIGVPA